jgi:hypothetical protein
MIESPLPLSQQAVCTEQSRGGQCVGSIQCIDTGQKVFPGKSCFYVQIMQLFNWTGLN